MMGGCALQVVFARDADTARLVSGQIAAQATVKLYLARVAGRMHALDKTEDQGCTKGEFCTTPHEIRHPIYCIQARPGVFSCSKQSAVAAMTANTNGKRSTREDGALPRAVEAQTLVWPVCYDPQKHETLVLCRPVTGRTHQIRCVLHIVSSLPLPTSD